MDERDFYDNTKLTLDAQLLPGGTSVSVADAGPLVTPTGNNRLFLTLVNQEESLFEIVECTAVTGNLLTVVRAQEGTTALTWEISFCTSKS